MKTYQQFKETSLEKREEDSGLDLDNDHEKGESLKHKAKIKKKKEEMIKFFKTRMEGAAKIASEAESKGGAAILTAWHFKAKHKPYQEVIKAIEEAKPESFFVNRCKSLLGKIHCGNMKQEDFQKLMGELEVYMESNIHLFHN